MIDQVGRQRTAVNQPNGGGSNYPFVAPSSDITDLWSDFYLSYQDDVCDFVLPFRVAWMYGFGTDVVAAPGGFSPPTHSYDVLVVDANGRIVFDSTQATTYHERPWGNRKAIEWNSASSVCRLVFMRSYRSWETPRTYDSYIVPASAELDARTYERLPLRVLAFEVGNQIIAGDVVFQAGYNIALSGDETARQDGAAFIDQINMDAVVGAGLGRLPGCAEEAILLRTINSVGPDPGGNFTVELGDCYRAQLPLFIEDNGGRRTGQYSHPGYTTEQAHSMIRVYNDCKPCCECDYFYRVYKGLVRVYDRWAADTAQGEAIRDQVQTEIDRWNTEYQCRLNNSVNLLISPEGSCKAGVAGAFCNFTDCCVGPVALIFTITSFHRGVPSSGGVTVGDTTLDSAGSVGSNYSPEVAGNVVTFHTDLLSTRGNVTAKMRVCIKDCQPGSAVRVRMDVRYDSQTLGPPGVTCELPKPDPGDPTLRATITKTSPLPNAASSTCAGDVSC